MMLVFKNIMQIVSSIFYHNCFALYAIIYGNLWLTSIQQDGLNFIIILLEILTNSNPTIVSKNVGGRERESE